MRSLIIYTFLLLLPMFGWSQKEFHVFPKDHDKTPGMVKGNGSLQQPWDLQTALSMTNDVVNGGDTIWIHEGIYNGRFTSKLASSNNQKIVVAAYKTDKVIIDGHAPSTNKDVLRILGGKVIFKNFEITFSGPMSRYESDANFKRVDGLIHISGEDCEFINLKIHSVPGLGVGSWKATAGSVFDGCIVFNNGYVAKNGKGTGEGFYVQNTSQKTRIIKNCIIFNNYYKGIEVWSANKRADYEYVKNIRLENNVLFNNGLPSGHAYDNIIVASDDRNGVNVAQNVSVLNNILYHNTNFVKNEINGNAASLTIGFHANAPVKNVVVKDNVIIGRNNALRILHAKTLTFVNNIVYSGYVMQTNATKTHYSGWTFDNNVYYTKNSTAFFLNKSERLTMQKWKDQFKLDRKSSWQSKNTFDLDQVLDITALKARPNTFRVTLFQKQGEDVLVDFSDKKIPLGTTYAIKNIANGKVIVEGQLDAHNKIRFPMGNYNETSANFGVYHIVFQEDGKKKNTLLRRIFNWIF